MEASRIEEPEVPSRGLSRKRPRPTWSESGPPGSKQDWGGDEMLSGADALLLAEQNAAQEGTRWPARRGPTRRETERFGGARRRKPLRVVKRTRYGCSSSEKRIGGLQTLVLCAFGCEMAAVEWRSDYGGIAGRSSLQH